MAILANCPRCSTPVVDVSGRIHCPEHGESPALWRPDTVDYDHFARLIGRPVDTPTYVPWPMSPGWEITDFGWVGPAARPVATITTTRGHSDLDGVVELSVVVEEPGVGLGARCARTPYDDPGASLAEATPEVRVRAGGRVVNLWAVETMSDEHASVAEIESLLPRSVFAGEANGRWLWLVITPASAALLLHDEWLLADVTGFGPEALEMPFGQRESSW